MWDRRHHTSEAWGFALFLSEFTLYKIVSLRFKPVIHSGTHHPGSLCPEVLVADSARFAIAAEFPYSI